MAHSSRRSPIAEANDDIRYADRVQRETEKRRRDATMESIGGKNGMSSVDQNAIVTGTNASPRATQPRSRSPVAPNGGSPVNPAPGSTEAINASLRGQPLPPAPRSPVAPPPQITSNLNANTPNALAAGATAASPPARATAATRFVAPSPLTSPQGNATTDAAAVKQNLAIAQNPTSFQQPPSPVAAAAPQMTASAPPVPTMGKVLPVAQADALLGPVTGANGYGTGSVRIAKAGETLPPATVTANGVSRAGPFDENAARVALFKSHPAIFQAGTPENAAFVAHHKQYGAEAAYTGAPALMATLKPSQGGPTPQTAKNDIGGAPTPEALAAHDATMAAGQPSLPVQAGRAIAQSSNAVSNLGNAVANAPRAAANAIDSAISGVATGITGKKQTLNPIASAGRAVNGAVRPTLNAAVDAGNTVAQKTAGLIRPLTNPTAPQGPEPTFQPGDAKWSGRAPVAGPPAPTPAEMTRGDREASALKSPLEPPFVRERQMPNATASVAPIVPPTQSPPVSETIDQDKLKKRAARSPIL